MGGGALGYERGAYLLVDGPKAPKDNRPSPFVACRGRVGTNRTAVYFRAEEEEGIVKRTSGRCVGGWEDGRGSDLLAVRHNKKN